MMNLKQEAVKGVVWSAFQKWGVRVISFVVMLILARLVLPESFGLIAYATVFTAFVQIFVDQGFSDAIVQLPNLEREHLDTAFWINVVTGTIFTVASVAASGFIANLFHEPKLIPVLRSLSLIFIISALISVQQALLRRKMAFKSLTTRSLIAQLASAIVAVSMAFMGFGVWALVAKLLVEGLVDVIVLWQVSDWRPGFHVSGKHFKQLFRFGINIVGGDFVDYLSVHSDDFLIGYFLGPTILGYYTLAYNLLIVMTDLLISVPNAVAFPLFSRIQTEPARLKSAFYEVTQLQATIAFPIFLGVLAVAPETVRVLYGDSWITSIPVMQLLMLVGIVRSASLIYSSIFRSCGKPSWRFGLWSLTAVMNVIGFWVVVRLGIIAVAASYVFVSYFLMPLYILMVRRLIHISIKTLILQYVPAVVGSLAMIGVVFGAKYLINDALLLPIRLLLLSLAGGVTYILSLWIIQPSLFKKLLEISHLALPKFSLRQS
jgi:O-antigen/teichoic acid export membrane protein